MGNIGVKLDIWSNDMKDLQLGIKSILHLWGFRVSYCLMSVYQWLETQLTTPFCLAQEERKNIEMTSCLTTDGRDTTQPLAVWNGFWNLINHKHQTFHFFFFKFGCYILEHILKVCTTKFTWEKAKHFPSFTLPNR